MDVGDQDGPELCPLCDRPATEEHEHLFIDLKHPDAPKALEAHGYFRAPAPGADFHAGWAAAIEAAAKAVEDTDVVEARGLMGSYYAQLGDAKATLAEAAAAIRSLSPPAPPRADASPTVEGGRTAGLNEAVMRILSRADRYVMGSAEHVALVSVAQAVGELKAQPPTNSKEGGRGT